ncbi:MAG: gamma-butyrobetaine hydroxylase-like domain-containing protein [Methyloceanibacter sp.]
MADPWPTELRLDKDKRVLTVTFDDGQSFALPAELLRVLSPSAEVQGHSEAQRVTVAGKKQVGIVRIEPVGNYAARIVFDDGHDTGLFVWDYLRELGENRDARWQSYLNDLAAKGLVR